MTSRGEDDELPHAGGGRNPDKQRKRKRGEEGEGRRR